MKFRKYNNKYLLAIDKGSDIVKTLTEFCRQQNIKGGSITGLGAATKLQIAYYNLHTKQYQTRLFDEDYEIVSLLGNVSSLDGNPALHLHIVIADDQYRTYGGHLMSAEVSVTCEVSIDVLDVDIQRKKNPEFDLNLLELS